jgi:hypothetical protein
MRSPGNGLPGGPLTFTCQPNVRRRFSPFPSQLPAALLARMLGIDVAVDVVVAWQHASSGDWMTYAADIGRRPSKETS